MQPDIQLTADVVTAFAGFVAGIGVTLNGLALRRALRDAQDSTPRTTEAPAPISAPFGLGAGRPATTRSTTATPLAA